MIDREIVPSDPSDPSDHQEGASSGSGPGNCSSRSGRRTPFLEKPPLFWVRILLGGIFWAASVDKIHHPEAFAKIIHNYQVLPDLLINVAALILPWLEVLLGFLLIFGLWLPGTALLVNLLLLTFWGTLIFNVARGLDVHCGCFSTGAEGKPETAWYLVRDSAFVLLGAYLFYRTLLCPPSRGVSQN